MLILIYSLCFIILLLIMWAVLIPAATFTRGYLLGVNLPNIAEMDEEIIALAKAYKEASYYTLLASVILFIPVILLNDSVSFQLTYFLMVYIEALWHLIYER